VEPNKSKDTNEDVDKIEDTNEDVDKDTSFGECYSISLLFYISFHFILYAYTCLLLSKSDGYFDTESNSDEDLLVALHHSGRQHPFFFSKFLRVLSSDLFCSFSCMKICITSCTSCKARWYYS